MVLQSTVSDTVGDESIKSVYIEISSTGPATRSEGILIPEGRIESKEMFPKQAALALDIHRCQRCQAGAQRAEARLMM